MSHARELLLERRHETPDSEDLWDKLTLAQKCASSSLTQSGYELAYIRQSNSGNLAILLRDEHSATVCHEGDINTSPDIVIRP